MPSKSEAAFRCVGTGFIVLDIIRSAVSQNVALERRFAGGSCGNVLAILSYLGYDSTAVGHIGDDRAGNELVSDLKAWNVDVRYLFTESTRRTPAIIQESFVDTRGRARHRFSRECPLCGATMPRYRPLLLSEVAKVSEGLPEHRVFYFDRVAPGPLELARKSRKQGAFIVFEPSGVKDERLFVECLRTSHVLKYSHERLSDLDRFVGLSELPVQIETLGIKGLRVRARQGGRLGEWLHLPSLPAPTLRDAAGSGDWCTAGFISRLGSGTNRLTTQLSEIATILDSLRFGQALAALNCAYSGARGLMYSVKRARVLKAAKQLMDSEEPKLPKEALPALEQFEGADESCAVCVSEASEARAPHFPQIKPM